MKTTVELPDELLRQVKELARSQGVTMRELLIEGLRSEVARRTEPAPRVDFVFRSCGGDGLDPDVDPTDLTRIAYGLPL